MSAHSRWPLMTGVAQGRYYCIYIYVLDQKKGRPTVGLHESLQSIMSRNENSRNVKYVIEFEDGNISQ